MEFTAASNNVLTRLFSGANDKWVRLGELAKTFNELSKISSVIDLDGNTHDRGDRVLHHTDTVGIIVV